MKQQLPRGMRVEPKKSLFLDNGMAFQVAVRVLAREAMLHGSRPVQRLAAAVLESHRGQIIPSATVDSATENLRTVLRRHGEKVNGRS